jgi:hypothetical protein
MTTSQPSREPTIYFKVDRTKPDAEKFAGKKNGELLNEGENGFSAHLAPGFQQEAESGIGKRLSREGNGDIVIEGISEEGWRRVTEVVDKLDLGATRGQIEDALIGLDWITWERPLSGH